MRRWRFFAITGLVAAAIAALFMMPDTAKPDPLLPLKPHLNESLSKWQEPSATLRRGKRVIYLSKLTAGQTDALLRGELTRQGWGRRPYYTGNVTYYLNEGFLNCEFHRIDISYKRGVGTRVTETRYRQPLWQAVFPY